MRGSSLHDFSAHARTVMEERGILPEWVDRVLRAPETTTVDKADPDLQHALGRIAERSNRVLRVVYNAKSTPWRIVTVYFDRGLRGKV